MCREILVDLEDEFGELPFGLPVDTYVVDPGFPWSPPSEDELPSGPLSSVRRLSELNPGGALKAEDLQLLAEIGYKPRSPRPLRSVPRATAVPQQIQIYALIDPRDHAVRYIGRSYDAAGRLARGHLYGSGAAVRKWLLELQDAGYESPILEIIETVPERAGGKTEKKWINHHRRIGTKLLNYEFRKV